MLDVVKNRLQKDFFYLGTPLNLSNTIQLIIFNQLKPFDIRTKLELTLLKKCTNDINTCFRIKIIVILYDFFVQLMSKPLRAIRYRQLIFI